MKKVVETFNKDYETWLHNAKLFKFGLLDIPIITSAHLAPGEWFITGELICKEPVNNSAYKMIIRDE